MACVAKLCRRCFQREEDQDVNILLITEAQPTETDVQRLSNPVDVKYCGGLRAFKFSFVFIYLFKRIV